jgi:hypothetical protein
MKKQFARAVLAAALLCSSAGAAMVATTTTAYAQEKVSREVGKNLNETIQAIQKKDYAAAATSLQAAEAVSDLTDFDKVKINQIKGYLAVQQKDYKTATTAYNAVLASPAFKDIDPKEQAPLIHNAFALNGATQNWAGVINVGKIMEAKAPLDANANISMAQAYYFTNDFANSLSYAEKSIALSKAAGQKPNVNALRIAMTAQVQSKDQAGALKTLEQLALNYDNKQDWTQLLDIAMGTKGISELDALYLYRLRFLVGATASGDDYKVAAGVAVHLGYPAEAETVLKSGIAAGKLRDHGNTRALLRKAESDASADKRSLTTFARMAKQSKHGVQSVKLAEDYWGYGRYEDAIAAAKDGIAKGHLKDASEGNYILGISQAAAGHYAEAQATLAKVDGNAARARGAHLWSLYAQSKMLPATAQAAAPQQ